MFNNKRILANYPFQWQFKMKANFIDFGANVNGIVEPFVHELS